MRVSGRTDCVRVSSCAAHFLAQQRTPVDFLAIGTPAIENAVKAIGLLKTTLSQATQQQHSLLIDIIHVAVSTDNGELDGTVFRCLVLPSAEAEKINKENGA